MRVAELIRELQRLDPEAEVMTCHVTSHYSPKTVAESVEHLDEVELTWSDYTGTWIVPSSEARDQFDKTKQAVVINGRGW